MDEDPFGPITAPALVHVLLAKGLLTQAEVDAMLKEAVTEPDTGHASSI